MALQHPPAPVSQPSAHRILPTLATGLTDQDRKRIEDALDRSVSANTRRSYASAWRSFEEWTQARGVPSLPAPPELVITNLPFDEWTDLFGSERLTGALMDRLTHHVHILEMNGYSYRLKNSRENAVSQASEEPADA